MIYDIILLLIIISLISIYVYVKSMYNTYSKIKIEGSNSGFEIARKTLDKKGLEKVYIIEKKGFLLDNLDLQNNALYLCKENFDGENISSFLFSSYYAIDKPSYNIKFLLNLFTNGIFLGLFISLLIKNNQLYTGLIICLSLLIIIKIIMCNNNYKNSNEIINNYKGKNKEEINKALIMIYLEPLFAIINNIVENFKAIL